MTDDSKVNILVVDDLPEKRLVMESILGELGENVIIARSGEEALLQVLRHDFAVILLDVNMPSLDGYETAALIRKRRRSAHTPIIFITGYADELHKAQGYSLGAVDYVLSPVNPDMLRTKVRVFVELFRMAEQAKRHADERVALMQEQAARMAAEAAHRQSSFLAETSATLAHSLDHEATVRGMARQSVPFLADLSAVTLTEAGSPAARTEVAFAQPDRDELGTATLETGSLPRLVRTAIARVLDSAVIERIDRFADFGTASTHLRPAGEAPSAVGIAVQLGSALVLPLRARNQVLGCLTLVMGHSGRSFGPAETLLAQDMAGRAAIFLDNARLYRDIQESDARKNEFLAMLAHELRNPLAAIQGANYVLRISEQTPDKIAWAQAIIDRQVSQLVRLVDDLLDVARITQGKIRLQLEPVEITAVIELAKELSGPLITARRHRLVVAPPAAPLWVRGDVTRLAQVLANLLNNAAKYTDEGGLIQLHIESEPKWVLLRVRDNGIGISPEIVQSIFDLFTQATRSLDRAQGGLGIGLTLVRHLVGMHGGSVSVRSGGLGQGSEFVVRLPRLPDPPAMRSSGGAAATAPRPPRRVLVVDDNQDVADSLLIILQQQGHEVRAAHDGLTALKLAESYKPEVVLLDIGLPGLDGYEVARRLRALPELHGALLIALTGYGQSDARRRALDAGFDVHLVKPVDPQTLTDL
ncbi:MAG TPA: response regulator, partial [Pseudomonadota bacterium]|nr:response regulator [Pseudomonadota bacterium]